MASQTNLGSTKTSMMANYEDVLETVDFAAATFPQAVGDSDMYYYANSNGSVSSDCASVAQHHGQLPALEFTSTCTREWKFEERRELRQQVAMLDSYGLNQVLKIVYPGEPVLAGKAYTIDMANVRSSVCDAIDALLRPAPRNLSSKADQSHLGTQAEVVPTEGSAANPPRNMPSLPPQPSALLSPDQSNNVGTTALSSSGHQGSDKPFTSQTSSAPPSSKNKKPTKSATTPRKKVATKAPAVAAVPAREVASVLAPVSSKNRKLPSRSPGVPARVEVQFGDSEWISASVLATSSNKQLLLMDKDLTLKWMALKDHPHSVLSPQCPSYSNRPRVAGSAVRRSSSKSALHTSTQASPGPSQLPLHPPPPPSAVATVLRRLCFLDLMDHMPFWTAADEVTARDALVDEEIEEDLQALSQCSSGHALGTHEALSPAICNNCQNEFPAGSVAFGCRRCNFDLCYSCGMPSIERSRKIGSQQTLQSAPRSAASRQGGSDSAQDVRGFEVVLSRLERGLYHTPAQCLQAVRSVLASAFACSEPNKVDQVRYAAAVLSACFEGEWQRLCDTTADKAVDIAAANRRTAAKMILETKKVEQKGSSAKVKPKIKPKAPAQLALEEAMALGSALGTLSARSLKVGDRCEARKNCQGKGLEWYAGTVEAVLHGFGYRVMFEDGGIEEEVPSDCIRVSSIALAAAAEAVSTTAQATRSVDALEEERALGADEEAIEEATTNQMTEPLPSTFLDHALLNPKDCWPCYRALADAIAGNSHVASDSAAIPTSSAGSDESSAAPVQTFEAAFDAPISLLSGNLLEGLDEDEAVLTVPTGWELVGAHVAIREVDQWFRGTVRAYDDDDRAHSVVFEFDGKEESICLDSGSVDFEIVLTPDKRPKNGESEAQLWRLGKLVWARSMPHPWWPGELCVPSRNHILNLVPPSDQPSALVLFAGDGSYDVVNSAKYLSPFVVSRPRQRVDPQKKSSDAKAVLVALDEQMKRADELFMITETERHQKIPKKRKHS